MTSPPHGTLNAMEAALTFSSRSLSAPAEGSAGMPLAAASDSASPAHNSRCIAMRRAERGARLGDDPRHPRGRCSAAFCDVNNRDP